MVAAVARPVVTGRVESALVFAVVRRPRVPAQAIEFRVEQRCRVNRTGLSDWSLNRERPASHDCNDRVDRDQRQIARRDHARRAVQEVTPDRCSGRSWLFLQPALLLSVYLFVYLVVFKVRFPGFSRLDYVLYVFAALVPYLGVIEGTNARGAVDQAEHAPRQERDAADRAGPGAHRPGRDGGECLALVLVILLCAAEGILSPSWWLPLALLLQVVVLVGLAWILSSLGVALPDISYFVNLFMFLLMFVSPIAFEPSMVPEPLRFVVYVNPVFYLIETFRDCLLFGRLIDPRVWAIQAALSLGVFALGSDVLPRLPWRAARSTSNVRHCRRAGVRSWRPRVSAGSHAMRETMRTAGPTAAHLGRRGRARRPRPPAAVDHRPADVAEQPMANEDGSLWVIFNGEIYNHAEIRRELRRVGGHRWKTDHSDTEVILHGFEQWGIDVPASVPRHVRASRCGTRDAQELWLVRDRIGVKPLYYSIHHGRLTFASEIKALLEDPRSAARGPRRGPLSLPVVPDDAGAADAVRRHPEAAAGTWLRIVADGRTAEHRYWDVWDARARSTTA